MCDIEVRYVGFSFGCFFGVDGVSLSEGIFVLFYIGDLFCESGCEWSVFGFFWDCDVLFGK